MTTPMEINNLLVETDENLKRYADYTVWFKAQRDYWRGRLEMAQKSAEIGFNGAAAKAKAFGITNGGWDTHRDNWTALSERQLPPLDESLALMAIMDELRRQWGLVYPTE